MGLAKVATAWCFWWATGVLEGEEPPHSLACKCPLLAEPVARMLLFHGCGANPRLLPGFIFFCGEK